MIIEDEVAWILGGLLELRISLIFFFFFWGCWTHQHHKQCSSKNTDKQTFEFDGFHKRSFGWDYRFGIFFVCSSRSSREDRSYSSHWVMVPFPFSLKSLHFNLAEHPECIIIDRMTRFRNKVGFINFSIERFGKLNLCQILIWGQWNDAMDPYPEVSSFPIHS